MKVYEKKLRNIEIDGFLFKYVIIEKAHSVIFRAYSGKSKTSFFEVPFCWPDTWSINLYRPGLCYKLIKFALENGWKHYDEKQVIRINNHWHYNNLIFLPGNIPLVILYETGNDYVQKTNAQDQKQVMINSFYYLHEGICQYFIENNVINIKGADILESLLKNNSSTSFLSIDRTKLVKSSSEWVYINIEERNELTFDICKFNYRNGYSGLDPDVDCKIGIEKSKGILTWLS